MMDSLSSMMDFMDIDAFLATRLSELRRSRGLTLAQLAALSGVSRSMISLIERQETSPTAAVLNKLADAFGLSLPALFAGATAATQPEPLARRADQPQWTDPATGYQRRHLTPQGTQSPIELVEVNFPPGATAAFDRPLNRVGIHQQLWLIEGAMDITLDARVWSLQAGDCLTLTLGERIAFHNPGPQPARYLLAVTLRADTAWRSA